MNGSSTSWIGQVQGGDGASPVLRWRVGRWEVDAGTNTIARDSTTTQVEPKVMQVLMVLIQHPAETLSVDYLLAAVWHDTVVEENALRRAISQLRKAFDDDPQQPQILKTVPRKGYRLIAPVAPVHKQHAPQATTRSDASVSMEIQGNRAGHRSYLLLAGLGLLVILMGAILIGHQQRSILPVEPMTNVPVTSLRGLETEVALSPDGSTVAFVWAGDSSHTTSKVYIKDIRADAPRRLTDEPGTELAPAWSPDGRRVAYLRRDEQECGLYMASVAGGSVRRLAPCGVRTTRGLTWSPDGAWIAFSEIATEGQPLSVTLLSPETLERHILTTPAHGRMDVDPVFSPGSDRLSFIRHEPSGQEALYVVPVAGGEPVEVLSDFGNIAEHDWAPDGQHLVFSSNQGGNYRLWQVPVAGGAPEWMAAVGAYDPSSPSFDRTGDRMAYVEWFFDFNIWHHPVSGASAKRLIASSKWDLHPQYAPDGRRIAFTSNRADTSELWIAAHDGTKPVRLTDLGDAFVSTPRWSPGGKKLAFEVRTHAISDIFTIRADGGLPQRLTDGTASYVAPSWSADGQWIYAGSAQNGQWQVWKIPAAGGAAVQVTRAGGFATQASPNGPFLYYTKADSAGIWRKSLPDGREEQVMDALATGDWGNWALHPDGIYFVRRTGGTSEFMFFNFATETTRTISPVGAPVAWHKAGLSLSPGGNDLLITHTDHAESDIRLVTPFR